MPVKCCLYLVFHTDLSYLMIFLLELLLLEHNNHVIMVPFEFYFFRVEICGWCTVVYAFKLSGL